MHAVSPVAKKSPDYFYKNFEDHPFPAFIIDRRDQLVIWLNKAASSFYSVDRIKFKKLTFQQSDFFHIDPPLHAFIFDDTTGPFNSVQRLNDGKDHYLEIYKQLFQLESRSHLCALFIYDNTEKKRLEDKLAQIENELKESLQKEKHLNDIKSRLLSTSSHEFRTPLTTILTSSELLAMVGRSWSEERYIDQIIKIQNAVTYMTGLLDDILTVDRTDRDVWRFNPSMINLYELCRKMLEEVSVPAKDTHKFSYDYLPGTKHAIVDEKLLQHVITNLLSNAVKYSPGGGQIIFRVDQTLSNLEFMISDEGIGIPEEDKGNLFETFYRCRNSTKIKGTGLGLAIVKRSVETHGGEIKFESCLNKGTTFRVLIPLMTSI